MYKTAAWRPQPRQTAFLQRPEYECFYGGAAGGGKSDSLLAEALRQVHIPHYRGIILRKTHPQLSELIDRSEEIYRAAFKGARYNDSKHFWRFPSGAKVYFGAMQYTKDRTNYQGKRYDFIGFDELTHFLWDEYSYMFSRNRPSGEGTLVYMRSTGNPGGVGHGWVKNRFITQAPPMVPIRTKLSVAQPNGKLLEMWRKRIFVPSSVFDNPKLLQNDPNYLANLAMLPEAERQALLYGNWDTFSGQVFDEWINNPDHYSDRVRTHVIAPFVIPKAWKIYRGYDHGYSKPFSVGWYAVDHDGRLYRIREFYGCTGTPNVGLKYEPTKIASMIREIESQDNNLKGRDIIGIADPAIFEKSHGFSVAELMEKQGIYFNRGDHTRIAGKMQLHYRFAFDTNGWPMLYVFNTCKHFIRTIPTLIYSESNVEDVDTRQEDHCLVGDTKVFTDNGYVSIKDLSEGFVYSSDGKLHRFYDCRLTQKDADIYTVEFEDGTKIQATSNHRFMLESGEFARLEDLLPGDCLRSL